MFFDVSHVLGYKHRRIMSTPAIDRQTQLRRLAEEKGIENAESIVVFTGADGLLTNDASIESVNGHKSIPLQVLERLIDEATSSEEFHAKLSKS